jgi:UDP-N-acetylmuramyl tripeptide synthase
LRYLPALLIGRLVRFAVRLVRPGGGSALPGLVVSKLAPGLVNKLLSSFPKGLVIITGTAGKSTTTKMAVAIARAHGLTVFTNPSTANIEQGFFSTLVKSGTLSGKYPADIAILEMDEGHAAALVRDVAPRFSVILNVFDDQLDRFIDPAIVREKLAAVAKRTTEKVILNADDQNCLLIAQEVEIEKDYFGIQSQVGTFAYSKTYLPEISNPTARNTVTKLSGREAVLETISGPVRIELPSRGSHFALDAVAAWTICEEILGSGFDSELAKRSLDTMPPVFSRGEIKVIDGEEVEFILIQNPISTQLNIDNLDTSPEQLMFAIGRDVHDPSWLWTVDYSKLDHVNMVSGFNFADAALMLSYNNIPIEVIEPDYFKAIDDFLALPQPKHGRKTVLYSADAMRRLRRYKGFTDPEDVQRV